MSTVAPETSPSPSPVNLLLDYTEPEGTVTLRSQDSYEFRVPKIYLIHSSPIFKEELLISPNPQPGAFVISAKSDAEESTSATNVHRLIHVSCNSTILISLLSYIFPVPPTLPSTTEQIIELLSVAQMYKMDVVLTHIRNHIAQRQPPLIREETAFSVYALAQKHGLRTEALQAVRCTLSFLTMDFGDLADEDKLGLMPGVFLHELWKYHERVRSNLESDIKELKTSPGWLELLGDTSSCLGRSYSGIPSWLDIYISNIGKGSVPISLDFTNFHLKLVYHSPDSFTKRGEGCISCSDISEEALRAVWEALMAVVQGCIAKAELDLAVGVEGTRPDDEVQAGSSSEASSLLKYSDIPGADIVLQSSDLINFRVHRWVLATSSPFFRDMFSLPQPSNEVAPHELPIVRVSEAAEVLNSLISILYPVHSEMPHSIDNILALLAATEKYDMGAVQSSIRAEVSRKKLLSPTDSSRAFHVYAVACSKRLIPEMGTAARLTLDYPLTFESIGEALRSFDGWALRSLVDFRLRCLDNLVSSMESFSDHQNEPSKFWVGCPENPSRLPFWLSLPSRLHFCDAVPTSVQFREEFLNALQRHIDQNDCHFCSKVFSLKGEAYCAQMDDVLEQARNVPLLSLGDVPGV